MRIMSFTKRWAKLNNPILFTTFRYPRKDKDWEVEEVVQIFFRTRSKEREELGIARIIRKEVKDTSKEYHYGSSLYPTATLDIITPEEAKEDGFTGMHGGGDIEKLKDFLRESAGIEFYRQRLINKMTLYWIRRNK